MNKLNPQVRRLGPYCWETHKECLRQVVNEQRPQKGDQIHRVQDKKSLKSHENVGTRLGRAGRVAGRTRRKSDDMGRGQPARTESRPAGRMTGPGLQTMEITVLQASQRKEAL